MNPPQRTSQRISWSQRLGRFLLRLVGWRMLGALPPHPRYVLIAAPHTSNWDALLMLCVGLAFGLKVRWLAKHTLFRPPFGWLMRRLGAIPVDRRARHDTVRAIADLIRESPAIALAISPEGTRSRTEHWRSGFYQIALEAGVPVVCGVLDYRRREGGFGPTFELSGDRHADMDRLRAYYADKEGYHPESFGPIRLRDEENPPARPPAVVETLDPPATPIASALGLAVPEAPGADGP